MKLRNKKTGEIIETHSIFENAFGNIRIRKKGEAVVSYPYEYNSLTELNAEWEDAPEEPSRHWFISGTRVYEENGYSYEAIADLESVGNHFKTKEEAERAIEKLKAWKRLKDKGFRFILDGETEMPMFIYSGANGEKCLTSAEESKQCRDDIQLLFGGEE